ncbi:P-loop containing nucleoside triphosphate hydrolase protein, partial [Ganoderma leucocontextum]
YKFNTPSGHTLLTTIARKRIPFTPHDYQLEGVSRLLDGSDLVGVLATGSGKTGFYLIYILTLLELSEDPSLCQPPYKPIPKDPCIVVVYPTNGLEEEQSLVFEKAGVRSLVINAGSVEQARKGGVDLWTVARSGVAVILLSPEQLTSPRFESLLQHSGFQSRVCALGVDEIHLLYSWGQGFRQSFRQLGHSRARFRRDARFIGTTATLLSGHPEETILSFLGLRYGEFYLLRRSNVRHNVQTIFRTSTRGLGGWTFPDLRWIVQDRRKTVIHCRTTAQSFRVAIYLWLLCPPSSDRAKRVRMYNALNWPSYNTETRRLMEHDPDAQIIVATASFMVGLDLPNIADVVIIGALVSADEHIQWEGRPGRDPAIVKDARCITYVTKKTVQTARALLDGKTPPGSKKSTPGKKKPTVQMEMSMVRLLLAKCATAEQNILYSNPAVDPPCSCPRCSTLASSVANPPPCRCSGCLPEDDPPPAPPRKRTDMNPVSRKQRLTRPMRAVGVKKLQATRMSIYRKMDSAAARALPPEMFFPDTTIKLILDRFALIDSLAALHELLADNADLAPWLDELWRTVQGLQGIFQDMRVEKEKGARERRKDGQPSTTPGVPGEFLEPQLLQMEDCLGSFQAAISPGVVLAERSDNE